MDTLDQLRTGERATIVDVEGQDGVAIRLMEMGLTEGEVIEPVDSAAHTGMVRVHGELWRAVCPSQIIPKGARVRVKKMAGLTLEVDPVEPPSASS